MSKFLISCASNRALPLPPFGAAQNSLIDPSRLARFPCLRYNFGLSFLRALL